MTALTSELEKCSVNAHKDVAKRFTLVDKFLPTSILLRVNVSQEMSSSTILFLDGDGTSVLLCSWDPYCSCWFFEFWDGKQKSVLYKWKIILTYVPVEGGVVGSNVGGFFDSSCKVVSLPVYYTEVLQCYVMACV